MTQRMAYPGFLDLSDSPERECMHELSEGEEEERELRGDRKPHKMRGNQHVLPLFDEAAVKALYMTVRVLCT
jgi:hypothetical protein